MAVRPSAEWKKRYQKSWSQRPAEHGDKDMPQSAKQCLAGNQAFLAACEKHGVKPTVRQARKWKQKRGKFGKGD